MLRHVGVADTDPRAVERVRSRAARLGLATVGAPTVAVAWDRSATPTIGSAVAGDGSFVVLDGELFPDDPAEPLATPDDMAATVLAALGRAGIDGLRPLHLEALVTWWDARSGIVTVARDHGGVVQGLLGAVGTTAIWSSDHASLLAAGLAPEPDPFAIDQLVTVGWLTPPTSYLRDARTIAAGHAVAIRPGAEPRVDVWFRHRASPPIDGPLDEQAAELGAAIVPAVARRAKGDRLGATLSAGVDSALVVAVLRRVLDVPVETFTFRYLGYEGQLNEDAFAAGTAALLGAGHTTVEVAPADLAERFDAMVRAARTPISFGVHSFKQDVLRDAGIDVVLGGSDPGFWHNPGRAGAVATWLRRVPSRARPALLQAVRRLRGLPKGEALFWNVLLANHPMKNEYATLEERRALFGPTADRSAVALARALGDATRLYRDEPAAYRTAFVFEQLAVPQYVGVWNQRWGRAFGFPVRAPLWDHQVMDVAERRRPWAGDKPVLRAFAATLLPDDRARAPKINQEMPLAHWLRGPLRDLMGDVLSPDRVARSGIAEPAAVTAIVDDHLAGRDRHWPLWQLMTAVEWALQLRDDRVDALVS